MTYLFPTPKTLSNNKKVGKSEIEESPFNWNALGIIDESRNRELMEEVRLTSIESEKWKVRLLASNDRNFEGLVYGLYMVLRVRCWTIQYR